MIRQLCSFFLLGFLIVESSQAQSLKSLPSEKKKSATTYPNKKIQPKKKHPKSGTKKYVSPVVDTLRFLKPVDWSTVDTTWQDTLLKIGQHYLGVPYRYGGLDARGFDCSGFVSYCFGQTGFRLPHEAGAQMRLGERIAKDSAQKGDLIFFGYPRKNGFYISHSGMVVSNENGLVKFIHSASHVGIRYDYLNQNWYAQRFVGIRRYKKLPILP